MIHDFMFIEYIQLLLEAQLFFFQNQIKTWMSLLSKQFGVRSVISIYISIVLFCFQLNTIYYKSSQHLQYLYHLITRRNSIRAKLRVPAFKLFPFAFTQAWSYHCHRFPKIIISQRSHLQTFTHPFIKQTNKPFQLKET